jgi:hypothetical protein
MSRSRPAVSYAAFLMLLVEPASGGVSISFLSQWTSAQGGNDHWYGVIGEPSPTGLGLDWNDALQQARSLGGDLVSLNSLAENEFVYANIASDASLWHSTTSGSYCYAWGPWTGLRAVNGSWAWSDGTAYSFSAWAPAEPYEGTVGWVQYYRYFQDWGAPIPDPLWDNTGSDRGMYAIVEWTFNPIPAPAAAPLLALAGLTARGRRRK